MYKSVVRWFSGMILGSSMLVSGCAQEPVATRNFIDEGRMQLALHEVAAKHQSGTRVWCVPFARDLSGIQIYGNANQWWEKAKGDYARSQAPAAGSVLAFKSTPKIPMGHVAVVSNVLSDRVIHLDHANWTKNRVSTQMVAMDVSPRNDWSAVRLESAPGSLGGTYPTHGFIYPAQRLAAN